MQLCQHAPLYDSSRTFTRQIHMFIHATFHQPFHLHRQRHCHASHVISATVQRKTKSMLVMMSSHIAGNMYPSLQSSTMVPRHATAKLFCQNPNAWVRDPTYSEHQMCVHCILAIPGARASISEVAALRKPGSWSPGLLPRGICPEQSFRALVKFEAYPAVIKASNDRHRPGGVFRITPTPGC